MSRLTVRHMAEKRKNEAKHLPAMEMSSGNFGGEEAPVTFGGHGEDDGGLRFVEGRNGDDEVWGVGESAVVRSEGLSSAI